MTIHCPECHESFDIPADKVGKKAKCSECAHVFIVPGSSDEQPAMKPAEKTPKKNSNNQTHVRDTAWLSLYLAALAVLLLLYRGQQSGSMAGMVASLLFAIAIETAALFLAVRGLKLALSLEPEEPSPLVRTAILVNGILIALFVASLLLTLYTLVAGKAGGDLGDLGGLGNVLGNMQKNMNEINKLVK